MKTRCVPVLKKYYEKNHDIPPCMAFSFAAYILFMKIVKTGKRFEVRLNESRYPVIDTNADILYEHWKMQHTAEVALSILQDKKLWDADLTLLPNFAKEVIQYLEEIPDETCVLAMSEILHNHYPR